MGGGGGGERERGGRGERGEGEEGRKDGQGEGCDLPIIMKSSSILLPRLVSHGLPRPILFPG